MNEYSIYRPATREYLRFYENGKYGPHVVWSFDRSITFKFPTRIKAEAAAEAISKADHLDMVIIVSKEIGRSTIIYKEEAS
jgi:hypothetical protein